MSRGDALPPMLFGQSSDARRDAYVLARQLLLERKLVEFSDSALHNDRRSHANRRELLVRDQRAAPGAGRRKEDLVVPEVRRPEDHAHAVLEGPHRHPHFLHHFLVDHRRSIRNRGHQRRVHRGVHPGFDLPGRHRREHTLDVLFGGHLQVRLLGGVGHDHASPLPQPLPGQAVDLVQRDRRQKLVRQLQLVLGAGEGGADQKGLDIAPRQTGGLLVLAFGETPLEGARDLGLPAFELRRGEPVAPDALGLREQRVQPALDPAVRHQREELVHVQRAHEAPSGREGDEEGRVGLLGQFLEARRHHALVQVLGDAAAEGGHGAPRSHRPLVQHRHLRLQRLDVGRDGHPRRVVERHLQRLARTGIGRGREALEAASDHALDGFPVEVPHGDHRHEIGPVPVPVEPLESRGGSRFQHLGLPDRQAVRIEGALEQDGELGVEHPGLRPPPEPPLLDHHSALGVHLLGVEEHGAGPVLEDLERRLQHFRIVHGDAQHVDGLVEAGVGVDVGTELHPDRLQVVDQLLLLEVLGAVEGHVLGEVGQTELVLILQDGAGVHHQAKLGAVLGGAVLAHVVAEAVFRVRPP